MRNSKKLALLFSAVFVVAGWSLEDTTASTQNSASPTTNRYAPKVPTEEIKPVSKMEHLRLSDLKNAGHILLPISTVSIFVNGILLGTMQKNWRQLKDSQYYNSCLFSVYLSSADMALSLLLGLPIGIRLTFEEKLREYKSLRYYTEQIGFLIYEYLFLIRMMIIAALSADTCLHIYRPFKHMSMATKGRIKIACGIIALLPILRLVPVVYGLSNGPIIEPNILCGYYIDNETDEASRYNPLKCDLETGPRRKNPGFHVAEMLLPGITSGFCWIVMLASNLAILSIVVQKTTGYYTDQQRADMNRKLIRSCIVIMLITLSFALTNFPLTYTRCATYFYQQNLQEKDRSAKKEFYMVVLTYFSLIFHPWLYILRQRTIKELFIRMKKRFLRLQTASTMMSRTSPKSTKRNSNLGTSDPRKSVPLIKKVDPAVGKAYNAQEGEKEQSQV